MGARTKTWLSVVNTLWPIVVAVLAAVFWMGDHVETLAQKAERIKNLMAPIEVRVDNLEKLVPKVDRIDRNVAKIMGKLGVDE